MLEDLHLLDAQIGKGVDDTEIHSEPIALLKERVKAWRKSREDSIGRNLILSLLFDN
jgi:hypothetical protein